MKVLIDIPESNYVTLQTMRAAGIGVGLQANAILDGIIIPDNATSRTMTTEEHNYRLQQIFDEIVERFGGCNICEWVEDYDYDENNISEYRSVGDVGEILGIIKRYFVGEKT